MGTQNMDYEDLLVKCNQQIETGIYYNDDCFKAYEDLLKYCYEHVVEIDLNNDENLKMYEYAIKYLMNIKIRTKAGWTREDAIFALCFLTQKIIHDNNFNGVVKVDVVSDIEYKKNCSKYSKVDGKEIFDIHFPIKLVKMLIGTPTIYGIQTVFKEISYLMQEKSLQKSKLFNKYNYIMALESIVREIDSDFYQKCMQSLYRENQANLYGFDCALAFIKSYNERLYTSLVKRKERIDAEKAKYRKVFSDDTFLLLVSDESFAMIDTIASEYIRLHPDMIEKYPVLSVGFNEDGTKKDILTLIDERNNMLNIGNKIDEVNDLYYAVANYKNYYCVEEEGAKAECQKLINYLYKTGSNDEFIFSLLVHRLELSGESQERIESFLNIIVKRVNNKRISEGLDVIELSNVKKYLKMK